MPTTAYLYPDANGATNDWSYGSYTNVDGQVLQPSTPTTTPTNSERIYAGAGGSLVNTIEFDSIPGGTDERITNLKLWYYVAAEGNQTTTLELSTNSGQVMTPNSVTGSGIGWYSQEFDDVGIPKDGGNFSNYLLTLTGPATIGKADSEDEYAEIYIEYTYDDVSAEDECYTAAGTDLARETDGGTVTRDPGGTSNIDDEDEWIAAWFQVVYLEQGETVTSARLMFTPGSDAVGDCLIKCDDADAPAALVETTNNVSGRTLTTASVTIGDRAGGVPTLVDVTSLVQEVVNRAGWTTGNSLVFVLEGQEHNSEDFQVNMDEDFTLCLDHPLSIPDGGGNPNDGTDQNTAFLFFLE